jgi:hypothetical protein
METHFVSLPNGSVYKIVSDHLVSALVLGKGGEIYLNDTIGTIPATFYTSTDGNYIGKEFVLLAYQTAQKTSFSAAGETYRILALENSEITVTRDDGNQKSYALQANMYVDLMLITFSAYRIESTGNIMIQSGDPLSRRSFFVPSVQGGFLGTVFYTRSSESWDSTEDYGFRIFALEGATVTIWDLSTSSKIEELEVNAGGGVTVKPKAPHIMLQSDRPIAVSYVHNGSLESNRDWGYGAGVTYFSVKANEEAMFFLPTNSSVEAYMFANEETTVTLDSWPRTIRADSYYLLTMPGLHTISSNKDILVQVIHWPLNPPQQGIENFGVAIPCIQTVNTLPSVTLTPLGEAFPTLYIIIGAGAAVAVLVGILIIKKR